MHSEKANSSPNYLADLVTLLAPPSPQKNPTATTSMISDSDDTEGSDLSSVHSSSPAPGQQRKRPIDAVDNDGSEPDAPPTKRAKLAAKADLARHVDRGEQHHTTTTTTTSQPPKKRAKPAPSQAPAGTKDDCPPSFSALLASLDHTHHTTITALSSEIAHLKSACQRHQAASAAHQAEAQRLRAYRDAYLQLRDSGAAHVCSISDEVVVSSFNILKEAVANLARNMFAGEGERAPSKLVKRKQDRVLFRRLSKRYLRWIGASGDEKVAFFTAAVWRCVVDELLARPAVVYQEEAGRGLMRAQDAFVRKGGPTHIRSDRLLRFHAARGLAGTMLEDLFPLDDPFLTSSLPPDLSARLDALASRLTNQFARYAEPIPASLLNRTEAGSTKEEQLHERLRGALTAAVGFCGLVARSKAHYVVSVDGEVPDSKVEAERVYWGFGVDGEVMERGVGVEVEGGGEMGAEGVDLMVDLVVVPALVAYGDRHGRNYERRRVLVKAEVAA